MKCPIPVGARRCLALDKRVTTRVVPTINKHMTYNPDIQHRRSIRLQDYDYSSRGAYFITICAQNRQCLFGDVTYGEMKWNDAGRMVEKCWLELINKFPSVKTDEYVVMPNHLHGILTIVGADLCVRPDSNPIHPNSVGAGLMVPKEGAHIGAPLPKILQWFKTMTTNEYIRGIKHSDWPSFIGKLWQRNYHERIVITKEELNQIRKYILDNPLN